MTVFSQAVTARKNCRAFLSHRNKFFVLTAVSIGAMQFCLSASEYGWMFDAPIDKVIGIHKCKELFFVATFI